MKAVVQRVRGARCRVDDSVSGSIDRGLVVFLGIAENDNEDDVELLVDKIITLRVFADEQDKMNDDLDDVDGGLLIVPNFTLYADVNQGRRPGFHEAAEPDRARTLYESFLESARDRHSPVESGVFGAMMSVSVDNDGPVTLVIESDELG